MSLEIDEIKQAKANGDREVSTGFSGGIRSLDFTGLEVGDVLEIPTEFKVFEMKTFNEGVKAPQYIWCKVNGTDNVKQFFPSTFTKRRTVYNEDGTPATVTKEDGTKSTFRVHTMGTAAEFFRSHATVAEGMDTLRGKKIKITKIEMYKTLSWNSTQVILVQIPTIDLVEE